MVQVLATKNSNTKLKRIMLTAFRTRHVRRYMEKNEETTMEEKVKLKINGG